MVARSGLACDRRHPVTDSDEVEDFGLTPSLNAEAAGPLTHCWRDSFHVPTVDPHSGHLSLYFVPSVTSKRSGCLSGQVTDSPFQ